MDDMGDREYSLEHFDKIFTKIIRDTIVMDNYFNNIISIYYSRTGNLNKLKEDILEKEFFTTAKKGEIIYNIFKEKFKEEYEGFKKKIDDCLEIRNKLAHTKGIEYKWVTIGYEFEKKKKIKSLKKLEEEYYQNYKTIIRNCRLLLREITADFVTDCLVKCVATITRTSTNRLKIFYLSFYDSNKNIASLSISDINEFDEKDINIVKKQIREFLDKKYPKLINKKFEIEIKELKEPELPY